MRIDSRLYLDGMLKSADIVDRLAVDQSIGRLRPARSDSKDTRSRLVAAVGVLAEQTGGPPTRLVDIADAAGISTATAYRHFASAEDAALAHVLQLPQLAIDRFSSRNLATDPRQRFCNWNEAWVHACLTFGPSATALRSPEGFLARRRRNEPVVLLVCQYVEPLLQDLVAASRMSSLTASLITWNAVSDPREVLDMKRTLRWSQARIVSFITDTTMSSAVPT
jgi:AcrR family transcriptional regulator